MISFLLSWNPRRSEWPEREGLLRALRSGGNARTRWGLRTKAVEPGDRLFFIRLGEPPKGIFARGSALSASYRDSHWDETKRAQGKRTWFVEVELNEMLDPANETLLSLDRLRRPPFDEVHWTVQGSGLFIPGSIADRLDREWSRLVNSTRCT